MKQPLLALSLLLLALPASAQYGRQEPGLSGELSLNGLYISSQSQFNTDGTARIDSLNQRPETETRTLFAPLGNVRYTFGRRADKQLFAGTTRSDIAVGTLAFELGYRQQLMRNGTSVAVSWLPTILAGETWADPFLLGSNRTTTDERGNAFRLRLENIAGSGVSLDTAYGKKSLDQERSGSSWGLSQTQQDSLRRNASYNYLKANYRLSVSRSTSIAPALVYIHTSADGAAYSNDSLGGELSIFHRTGPHQLALTAGYSERHFRQGHPLYGDSKRNDREYNIFLAYELQQLLGWPNLSLVSFAGYNQVESNLNFYDEEQLLASLGLNFRF
ncbi:DUF2860 domain-containing protein [Vibrio sp.]|uniref:DUF2860 domain-containing protein n=1 Tax=Vibrio sp. TaxID=678 RepID=UPI003D0FBBDC